MTNLDQENVWKLVKETRKSFLSQNNDPECQDLDTLLSDSYIKGNIDIVEEKLKLDTKIDTNKNVHDETLQAAAKMFTYLNYCPPKLSSFIKNLITTGTPRDIILGLTNTRMTLWGDQRKLFDKIFIQVMNKLNLKQYETIQIITKGKCYIENAIFGNCGKQLNSTDINTLGTLHTCSKIFQSQLQINNYHPSVCASIIKT